MIGTDYGDCWVCTDCYSAHHYGASQHEYDVELYDEDGNLVDEGVPLWFAGEDDEPVGGWHEIRHNHTLDHNCEPLKYLEGFEATDNTCSNHYYGQEPVEDDHGVLVPPCDQCGTTTWEDGIWEFSWSSCDGCGSHLGGSRYRLHLWKRAMKESGR